MEAENDERIEREPEHQQAPAYPRPAAASREQMIERHLGLARHLALRYRDRGEPLEDLVQVASLGLVKAVDRYDPARGVRFTTFAVPTILGELRRHFRDRGWAIHVPRDLKETTLRVTHAIGSHPGGAPTPAELAAATGLTLEAVLEALEVAGSQRVLSLDAPAGGEEAGTTMLDTVGGHDDELARARDRATLARLTRVLDAREREILRLRFEEDMTQSEIGARIGVSQMQVSRLIRSALTRMRSVAQEPGQA
ncbi:MAG: SigB/SigF/SigG family RNA polymerase sigma factor [Conexibacter sp.]